MSRIIYLIRHAKSSWDNPGQTDWERDLNDRGRRDGPRMAEYCLRNFPAPARILSSDSQRTRSTARFLIESGWVAHDRVTYSNELYLASGDRILDSLESLDENVDSVAVLAHNPGIHNAMVQLSRDGFYTDFPTFAIARLESAEKGSWSELISRPWRLDRFIYPRKLDAPGRA